MPSPPPQPPFPAQPSAAYSHNAAAPGNDPRRLAFPASISQDGRLPWVFGLLSFIGLPFLSLLAPGITMTVLGLRERRKNPVAARLGRNAAIFGAVNTGIVVLYLLVLFVASAIYDGGVSFEDNPVLIAGFAIPVAVYIVAVGPVLNLILAIIALVRPVSREKAAAILNRVHGEP